MLNTSYLSFPLQVCTMPIDTFVSEYGCWKQLVLNGALSLYGRPQPTVTRKLAKDAWKVWQP